MLGASTKKQNMLIAVFVFGLVSLFIARDICGIGLHKFVFLAFCAVVFAFAEYETLFYLLCFMIPLFNGLPGTYIMLLLVTLMFLKKNYIPKTILVLIPLFFILEMVASIWYSDFPRMEITGIVEYITFLTAFFMMLYDDSKKSKQLCLGMFFAGVLVYILIVMIAGFLTAPSNWIELFANGWFRFGRTNTGSGDYMMLQGNPNELAYYSLCGISIGLVALRNRGIPEKVFIIAAMIFMLATGILSLSRSFFIVFVFMLIMYLACQIRSLKKLAIAVGVITGIGILTVVILNSNSYLIDGILSRFTDITMETFGGRSVLFEKQWNSFIMNPRYLLIGTGVTQSEYASGIGSIHNMLLQILVFYGFPFAIVFLTAIFKPVLDVIRKIKQATNLIPLATVLLFVQTIQFVKPYAIMLPFAVAVYALTADFDEKNNALTCSPSTEDDV